MSFASWLSTGKNIPDGGVTLSATYRRGSQSSKLYIPRFDPILSPILGGPLFEGSFNLWADAPVELQFPATANLDGIDWRFVPIVTAKAEIGIVGRRPEQDARFLEVFATHNLVDRLPIDEGQRVEVRLLSGEHVKIAA